MVIRVLLSKLDLLAATLGLALGGMVIVLSYSWGMQQQAVGIAVILGCALYLLLRSRLQMQRREFSLYDSGARQLLVINNIVFLAAFTTSILLLNGNLYHRPPLYFVLVGLAAATIAVDIVLGAGRRSYVFFTIVKIIALALSLRIGIWFGFPTLMGNDIWWHADFANFISGHGHVPSRELYNLGRYNDFPIFHVGVASTELLLGTSVKYSIFYFVMISSVIAGIFAYVFGRAIGGVRMGLVSMLFLCFSDMILVRGVTSINTGSLVLCWFMLILALVFRRFVSPSHVFVMLVVFLAIIFTHQLTVFVALMALLGLLLGKWVSTFVLHRDQSLSSTTRESVESPVAATATSGPEADPPPWSPGARGRAPLATIREHIVNVLPQTVVAFAVGMVAYWMCVTPYDPESSVFGGFVSRFWRAIIRGVQGESSPYVETVGSHSVLSNVLYQPGFLILLLLSVVGVLAWLSPRLRTPRTVVAVLAAVFLLLWAYVSPFIIGQNVLPHRWLPFVYVLLAVLAACGALCLISCIRPIWAKAFSLSLATAILTFLMVTTPFVCSDSPLYDRDRTLRTAFMESEVQAAATMVQVYEGILETDSEYFSVFGYMVPKEGVELRRLQTQGTVDGVLLLRDALEYEPTIVSTTGTFAKARHVVLGPEFFGAINGRQDAAAVYINSEVRAYYMERTR